MENYAVYHTSFCKLQVLSDTSSVGLGSPCLLDIVLGFPSELFLLESDLKFPFSRFRDPGLVYLILHSFVSASSVKFSWNVYQEF